MREYTISDFKVGDFEDQNGNTWCTVQFKETGEPHIWVVKDPMESPERFTLDTKIYGEIKDWTSSKGKTSSRYYDHTKERDSGTPTGSTSPKESKVVAQPAADRFDRDEQITRNMVWKNMLAVYDIPSMGYKTQQWDEFWGNVELHTQMLLGQEIDEGQNAPHA